MAAKKSTSTASKSSKSTSTKSTTPKPSTVTREDQAKDISKLSGNADLAVHREDVDAVDVKAGKITIDLAELSKLHPNARQARLLSLSKTLGRFDQDPDRILATLDPAGRYDREPVPQRNREARANQGELVSGKLSDPVPVLS
jgi:hypothetical protein